jgi:hypothetical protein
VRGEVPPPEDDQNNNPGDVQQDFSEPLDPADAVVGEPEEEPEPEPQLPASPAETPSTSNNALIMQIKILSKCNLLHRMHQKCRQVRRIKEKKERKETGLYACLVNWACCWAKKVVQAFATLVEKSVTASTVLL